MDDVAKIAEGLSEAQRWALAGIAKQKGDYPAQLGAHMIERSGAKVCEVKGPRGWHKAQGLAFIGGPMQARLERKGLVNVQIGHLDRTCRLTPLGRRVRDYLLSKDTAISAAPGGE